MNLFPHNAPRSRDGRSSGSQFVRGVVFTCKLGVWLAFAAFVFTEAPVFAQTTIFSDGFEGTFPGSWTVGNDTGITTAKWGDNTAKESAGSKSAFCADNGSDTRTTYDNNLKTYMERRGVSLAGYTTATLSFKYWLNSESGFDFFTVNIRDQNQVWHAPEFTDSGNDSSAGWQSRSLNLNAYAGQTGLYIQFLFASDGRTVNASPSGVWVDEVSLVASASGDLNVTVRNQDGATRSGAIVSRYTSAWTPIDSKPTDANGVARWTGIAAASYNLEAYYNTEFWGSATDVPVTAGQARNQTITRHMPFGSNFQAFNGNTDVTAGNVPLGTTLTYKVTVRNNSSAAQTVRVDRDQTSPYDYDQTSSSQTIAASGGTSTFTLPNHMPAVAAQYFRTLNVETFINNGWKLTDSWAWDPAVTTEAIQNPQNEFFDDFHYSSPTDSSFVGFGWIVQGPGNVWGPGVAATWRPSRVSFVASSDTPGDSLLRISGRTDGSVAGTEQSDVGTTWRFRYGTFAARARLADTPTGSAQDRLVEACLFVISPDMAGEPYSELDFEYLPNGSDWDGDNKYTQQLFATSPATSVIKERNFKRKLEMPVVIS